MLLCIVLLCFFFHEFHFYFSGATDSGKNCYTNLQFMLNRHHATLGIQPWKVTSFPDLKTIGKFGVDSSWSSTTSPPPSSPFGSLNISWFHNCIFTKHGHVLVCDTSTSYVSLVISSVKNNYANPTLGQGMVILLNVKPSL